MLSLVRSTVGRRGRCALSSLATCGESSVRHPQHQQQQQQWQQAAPGIAVSRGAASRRCMSSGGDDEPPPPCPPGYNDQPTEKIVKMVDDLLNLSVLEHHLFSKEYQRRLGITDDMIMGMGGGGGGGGGAAAAAPAPVEAEPEAPKEEKKELDVKLTGFDDKSKIKVIKEVRTITGLGLKEAKDLVEGAPKIIKKAVKREEAEKIAELLKGLGAEISLE